MVLCRAHPLNKMSSRGDRFKLQRPFRAAYDIYAGIGLAHRYLPNRQFKPVVALYDLAATNQSA
jgi:hypothetical protein